MILWIKNGNKCKKTVEEVVGIINRTVVIDEIIAYEEDSAFAIKLAEWYNIPFISAKKGQYDLASNIRDGELNQYADLILDLSSL